MVTLELRRDAPRGKKQRVYDRVNGLLVTDHLGWVLDALLGHDPEPTWGAQIAQDQNLRPDAVNRILRRLLYAKLIRQEGTRVLGKGRDQRVVHLVRLTPEGADAARTLTEGLTAPSPAHQPPSNPPDLSRSVARIALEMRAADPEPLHAQGLSQALSVHYNTASAGLKRLVSLGWVSFQEATDPSQSRQFRYAHLTEAGRRAIVEHVASRPLTDFPGK